MHYPEKGDALDAQERLLLAFLAAGWTNQRISDRIGMNLHTVARHFYRIYTKLGVSSRVQAALAWHGCDIAPALETAERMAGP